MKVYDNTDQDAVIHSSHRSDDLFSPNSAPTVNTGSVSKSCEVKTPLQNALIDGWLAMSFSQWAATPGQLTVHLDTPWGPWVLCASPKALARHQDLGHVCFTVAEAETMCRARLAGQLTDAEVAALVETKRAFPDVTVRGVKKWADADSLVK